MRYHPTTRIFRPVSLIDELGLNLTVATRIHIVEPQWNPTVESQALGRAVRIGQEKQVTIIRYVMLNTVEQVSTSRLGQYILHDGFHLISGQYIQSRQSRKLQIAELVFDIGSDEDSKDVRLKKIMVRRYSVHHISRSFSVPADSSTDLVHRICACWFVCEASVETLLPASKKE